MKTSRDWTAIADETCGHGSRKRDCDRCLTALFGECQQQALQVVADLVTWIGRRNRAMGAAARDQFIDHGKVGALRLRKRQQRGQK